MTQVTYNNIVIKDVLTHSVDQDVVYDSDGEVDQWYVKTTVTVRFTFHTIDGAGLGYSNGQDLAGSVSQALKALTTSRKRFTMEIGGNVLFDVAPGAVSEGVINVTGQFDVNNGPRPKLQIEEIIGARVARGTFTVELAVPSCSGYSQNSPINLRWWTADDVDANWYTTRTIHGRLRIASKENNPHHFRNLIFPPLQRGFKRESMSFTESTNGLELGFTIKDVEKFRSAPFPATSWRGTHRIVSQVPGLAIVESECTVTLEGAHDTPQTQLIALGVRIVNMKLLFSELGLLSVGNNRAHAQIVFYAVEAPLHENSATVTARIKHTGLGTGGVSLLPHSKKLGESLPPSVALVQAYDPLVSRLLPGPTAPLTALISRLQTPCNPAEMDQAKFSTGGAAIPTTEGAEYPVMTGDLPTEQKSPGVTEEHIDKPYVHYSMRVKDFQRTGRARMETGTASSSKEDDVLIVDLTKGSANRTIWVTAKRLGDAPEMLTPKDEFTDENGITNTLFDSSLGQRGSSVIDANGTQEFFITQILRYHLKNDPNIAELGTVVPLVPWLKPEAQDSRIPPGIFKGDPAGGI